MGRTGTFTRSLPFGCPPGERPAFDPCTRSVYEGEYKGKRRDGVGIYRFGDGRAYASTFVDNKPVGTGVFWTPNRQKAWRVVDGDAIEEISAEEAKRLAAKIGQDVPLPKESFDS